MVAARHTENSGGTAPHYNASASEKDEPRSSFISSVARVSQVINRTWFFCSHPCVSFVLVWPPRRSHIAYFCVQSLANLLYLRITHTLCVSFDGESCECAAVSIFSHSPFPVSLVCVSDFRYQWVVRIRVTKQRADGQ